MNYYQPYHNCSWDETSATWIMETGSETADVECKYEITYEFICWSYEMRAVDGANEVGTWEPLEGVDCPAIVTYFSSSSDVSFTDFEGYYMHWYESDPWTPQASDLYTTIVCYKNVDEEWVND